MSISTLANLEGRNVFTEVLSGREIGEGPYIDLQLRAGGQGDDTRKISFQVNDGSNYVEQASLSKRGLNIKNIVIRDSIVFDRGDGSSIDQFAGSIESRRDDNRAEIAFNIGGTGPGKRVSFNSLTGAEFTSPAHFQGVLRAHDLRVHGTGAVFTGDGADAAYIRVREGVMAFQGAHVGDGDFSHVRASKVAIDRELIAYGCTPIVFSSMHRDRDDRQWMLRACGEDNAFSISSSGSTSPFVVCDNDPSGQPALEVLNGNVIARKDLRGNRLQVRTAHVTDHFHVNHLDGASANFAGIVGIDISVTHMEADEGKVRMFTARRANIDADLHVHNEVRTHRLRVDTTIVAHGVHVVDVHAQGAVSAAIIQGVDVVASTLRASQHHGAGVVVPLRVAGSLDVTELLRSSRVKTDKLTVRGDMQRIDMENGALFVNGERTVTYTEGRMQVPFFNTTMLTVDTTTTSPLVKLNTIEAIGGLDTGTGNVVTVQARGLTLGNVYIDGSARIEVVGTDHNGILEFIAKNGVLIRSGDEDLGAFEPPMWQVIKGQGVRQSGSLYMITPGTGRYIKLEPPSTTDQVFKMYVNTDGQSLITLETEPDQTRIPLRLLVGSSLVDCGCGDGSGTTTPSAALQVRSASTYGGPTAVFHVTNPCADAEIKVKAESKTSVISLETAVGHVRIEHRADANALAFFNDETGNDFLVVDTISGLARIAGDLVVGGSLFFGAAVPDTSDDGDGLIFFPQGLSITSGLLELGNVELRAMGDTRRVLEISASMVNAPIIYAPSFAITKPPDESSVRQFGFNCYVDQIGIMRHIERGSAAVFSHMIRQPGETAPSSVKLGFSPRTFLVDSFGDAETSFEVNDNGEIHLTNLYDFGRFNMKQDRILQQVQFQTTRSSYNFDQTTEVVGDVRVKQVGDTPRYHSLRSTDDGLYVQGVPSSYGANADLGLPGAVILGDGYPDGKRWRMRVSPASGDLVFEYQGAPGADWSSKFRMVAEAGL